MKYFVIADTHFGHLNVIKYCNRPFIDVNSMDETLIKNWNAVVSKIDTVFVLGDFSFYKKDKTAEICSKLNGQKILIIGNHDNRNEQYYRDCGFISAYRYPIVFNNFCLLSHEPLQLSETTPYFNYYGHVHNDNKYFDNATSKCVSVERINYQPYLMHNS